MNDRRRFSSRERVALYLESGGRCRECGVELEPGWHADHISPWSRGGVTDVINGRSLCPSCNLKKGDSVFELRPFQSMAVNRVKQGSQRFYLMDVNAGGGKTMLAAACAQAVRPQFILYVAPNRTIRDQAPEEFKKLGLELLPDELPYNAKGYDGIAVTYPWLSNHVGVIRNHLQHHRSIVFLDEIHHLAESEHGTWYAAVDNMQRDLEDIVIVGLTGTSFRADNRRIGFVTYDEEGRSVADVTYSYKQSIIDGYCRPIQFFRQGGTSKYAVDGQIITADISVDAQKTEAGRRLWACVHWNGEWLWKTVEEARAKLNELASRQQNPACLIACPPSRGDDDYPAKKVYERLQRLGESVELITTREDNPKEKLKNFRKSSTRFLVTVDMVSEGANIPRISCLIHATVNGRNSEAYCRQLWGRAIRRNPNDVIHNAFVWIPDDPSIRSYAKRIEGEAEAALRMDPKKDGPGTGPEPKTITFIDSALLPMGILASGEHTDADLLARIRELKATVPGLGGTPEAAIAELLRLVNAGPIAFVKPPEEPRSDRAKNLSITNAKLHRKIVDALGLRKEKLAYGTLLAELQREARYDKHRDKFDPDALQRLNVVLERKLAEVSKKK